MTNLNACRRFEICAMVYVLIASAGCDLHPPSNSTTSVPASFKAASRPQPPLVAMSLHQFNDWWQVSLDAQERPLGEVLAQLTQKVPNWPEFLVVVGPLESPENSASPRRPPLQRAITLKISGVSLLEAIERACNAAGLYPEYDVDSEGKNVIKLHAGRRSPEGISTGRPNLGEQSNLGPVRRSSSDRIP